jgi:hypothetical protein
MIGDRADVGHDGLAVRKDVRIEPLNEILALAARGSTPDAKRPVDVPAGLGYDRHRNAVKRE